jgi:hypothetical protein
MSHRTIVVRRCALLVQASGLAHRMSFANALISLK